MSTEEKTAIEKAETVRAMSNDEKTVMAQIVDLQEGTFHHKINMVVKMPTGEQKKINFKKPVPWTKTFGFVRVIEHYFGSALALQKINNEYKGLDFEIPVHEKDGELIPIVPGRSEVSITDISVSDNEIEEAPPLIGELLDSARSTHKTVEWVKRDLRVKSTEDTIVLEVDKPGLQDTLEWEFPVPTTWDEENSQIVTIANELGSGSVKLIENKEVLIRPVAWHIPTEDLFNQTPVVKTIGPNKNRLWMLGIPIEDGEIEQEHRFDFITKRLSIIAGILTGGVGGLLLNSSLLPTVVHPPLLNASVWIILVFLGLTALLTGFDKVYPGKVG